MDFYRGHKRDTYAYAEERGIGRRDKKSTNAEERKERKIFENGRETRYFSNTRDEPGVGHEISIFFFPHRKTTVESVVNFVNIFKRPHLVGPRVRKKFRDVCSLQFAYQAAATFVVGEISHDLGNNSNGMLESFLTHFFTDRSERFLGSVWRTYLTTKMEERHGK